MDISVKNINCRSCVIWGGDRLSVGVRFWVTGQKGWETLFK